MALVFERVLTEGLGDLSYLIGDDASGTAAVIDPRPDIDVYLQLARRRRVAITAVLQTHVHEDFVSGAVALAARTGATNFASHEDNDEAYGFPHHPVHDGDTFEFGGVVLTARHTPGHTPEHLAFLAAEKKRHRTPYGIFSGGSLLIDAAGRTDLLGMRRARELVQAQYRTLYEFFLRLDDHVLVHPTHAHGSACGAQIGDRLSSSIGYERRNNPLLRATDAAGFAELALGDLPPKPTFYGRLKKANMADPGVTGGLPDAPALPARDFRRILRRRRLTVVDTRDMLAFGGGHVPGALNIGARPELSIWAGWLLDPRRPLLLVLADDQDLREVLRLFVRTGFTSFAGYLAGGMRAWDDSGGRLARIDQLPVHELRRRTGELQVVDVRMPDEWRQGHIAGATHIFLPELRRRLGTLRKRDPVAVYCDSGYRASIGASILAQAGFRDVSNVPGSWQAWTAAGFPVTRPDPEEGDG